VFVVVVMMMMMMMMMMTMMIPGIPLNFLLPYAGRSPFSRLF